MVTGPLLQFPIVSMGEALFRDTGDGVFLENGKTGQVKLVTKNGSRVWGAWDISCHSEIS